MCLYRVIKRDAVVFSKDVYTLDLPKAVNGPDSYAVDDPAEMTGSPVNDPDEGDTGEPSANEAFVEEEVWKRLHEMIEQERLLIINQAQKEADDIRMQAYNEGLRKATADKTAEIGRLIERIEDTVSEMRSAVEARLNEYEQMLVALSVEIASKVLQHKIEQDDSVLTELARLTVNEARNSDWISVTLSDKLKMSLQELERIIRPAIMDGRFEVITKNVPPGTCIVETPDGIVDASIETQINNLKNMIEHIQTA